MLQKYYLQYQLLAVTFFTFLQCVWIFVQTGETKDTLAIKVSPNAASTMVGIRKNVTIRNFSLTWSPINKLKRQQIYYNETETQPQIFSETPLTESAFTKVPGYI